MSESGLFQTLASKLEAQVSSFVLPVARPRGLHSRRGEKNVPDAAHRVACFLDLIAEANRTNRLATDQLGRAGWCPIARTARSAGSRRGSCGVRINNRRQNKIRNSVHIISTFQQPTSQNGLSRLRANIYSANPTIGTPCSLYRHFVPVFPGGASRPPVPGHTPARHLVTPR